MLQQLVRKSAEGKGEDLARPRRRHLREDVGTPHRQPTLYHRAPAADIMGWVILCRREPSCALYDVQSSPALHPQEASISRTHPLLTTTNVSCHRPIPQGVQ